MKKGSLGTRFVFAKVADSELDEAVAYYNNQKPGLGDDFKLEVEQGIREVVQHPYRFATIARGTRRYQLKRFPYGLVYNIRSSQILFLAVMHLHRQPGYWRGRDAEFDD